MTKEQATILLEEVQSLQEKSAITCLSGHPGPGSYSNTFVVPKKGRRVETYYQYPKIEQLPPVCSFSTLQNGECLQLERYPKKGDWLAKIHIDLKDAYLMVPMAKHI